MKVGNVYIVKKRRGCPDILKVKIIEMTKLTLAVVFENEKEFERFLIADFQKKYLVIEILEPELTEP